MMSSSTTTNITTTNATTTTTTTTTTTNVTDDLPDYMYTCPVDDNQYEEDDRYAELCANNCVGLAECESCGCAVVPTPSTYTGGPWGQVMDVLFCLLPIIFLIIVTVKPNNPWPTTRSLPAAAVIMFLVRVMYLGSDPLLTSGCIVLGLHEAWTPLTIMAGAITLFETMEATYCLPYMMREMKGLTKGRSVAETMLIFSFAYMIEGASGFGTPVALGAPMLVSTGHGPFESVVLLLVFNTFATVWGAVGTPIWFGFGNLNLSTADFVEISTMAAIGIVFASLILMPWVLTIMIPWRTVRQNLIFVLSAVIVCVGPTAGIAAFNYEFPALVGGLIGFCLTAVLIKCKFGLSKQFDTADSNENEDEDTQNINDALETIGSVSEHSIVSKYRRAASASIRSVDANIPSTTTTTTTTDAAGNSSNNKDTTAAAAAATTDNDNEDLKDRTVENSTKEEDDKGDGSADAAGRKVMKKKVPFTDDDDDDDEEAATAMGGGEAAPLPFAHDDDEEEDNNEFEIAGSLRETFDEHLGPRKSWKEGYLWELVWRTFPLWGVVLVLILTRVEQIGIKYYLTLREPYFEILFGTYGDFRVSVSVVFQLLNILTYPNLNWKYEFFYLPFIMPFILISIITMIIYRKDMKSSPWQIVKIVCGRLANPAIALMGALVLVQLMIKEGAAAPSYILGTVLSDWFKQGFVVITPLLGALGSFFSGSTTVSNLTFGQIQKIAAKRIGTSENAMLALQALGASAGNGICLNNIIAACAVVGLTSIGEGKIMVQTAKFVFSYTTIATVVMLAFFMRFE